jgi:hypothetical protein
MRVFGNIPISGYLLQFAVMGMHYSIASFQDFFDITPTGFYPMHCSYAAKGHFSSKLWLVVVSSVTYYPCPRNWCPQKMV